jgi:uncharacterized membrane protein (UPF0182 family)
VRRTPKWLSITTLSVLGALLLFFIILPQACTVYTNWLWLDAQGYGSVFSITYLAKLELFVVFGAVFFLFLWLNARLARRLAHRDFKVVHRRLLPEAEREQIERHADKILLVVSIVGALLVAWVATSHYLDWLLYHRAVMFGDIPELKAKGEAYWKDPIFGKDIGFYVFRLPFIEYVWRTIYSTLTVTLVVAAVVHIYEEVMVISGNRVQMAPPARKHVLALLAAVLFWKGLGYPIANWKLVTAHRGFVWGAGYTEYVVHRPVYFLLFAVATVCAAVCLLTIQRQSVRPAGMAVVALIVFAALGHHVAPALVQWLIVQPHESVEEAPYLDYNMKYTRVAYGLDGVIEQARDFGRELAGDPRKTQPETIANVRLWDDRPAEQVADYYEERTAYYDMADVDLDRYHLGPDHTAVMVVARQLDASSIPPEITWQKQHINYTHGYGFIVAPVSRVTREGSPDFIVADIPPKTNVPRLETDQPALYYQVRVERELPPQPSATPPGPGEGQPGGPPAGGQPQPPGVARAKRTTQAEVQKPQRPPSDFVIVRPPASSLAALGSDQAEVDYPGPGDTEKLTTYHGTGGVPLSWGRRVAFFFRFMDRNILFTPFIGRGSRILIYRTVQDRIGAIAPFLAPDPDPYLVAAERKLWWVQDTYTVTSAFPYSEPIVPRAPNYIRNSVKAVVDAYNGTVNLYVWDETDPIIRTYRNIFGEHVFKHASEAPPWMQTHKRYPELLFLIQTQKYQTYHMKTVNEFYSRANQWSVPNEIFEDNKQPIEAYYVLMHLPGQPDAEFILMKPFTPHGKEDKNLVAWMCARCDGDHYGELRLYDVSRQRLIYGPMLVEGQISTDPVISRLITLWNQSGSRVIRGNLLVIPIDDSILYVEPLYVQPESPPVPQLRLVVVYYRYYEEGATMAPGQESEAGAQEQLAFDVTLEGALDQIFAGKPAPTMDQLRSLVPNQGAAAAAAPSPAPTPAPAPAVGPARPPTPPSSEVADLVRELDFHWKEAQRYQSQGDYESWGREVKAVQDTIGKLKHVTGQ